MACPGFLFWKVGSYGIESRPRCNQSWAPALSPDRVVTGSDQVGVEEVRGLRIDLLLGSFVMAGDLHSLYKY